MEVVRKLVEACIQMIPTEEGGRVGPIFSGYRPNHNFGAADNPSMQMGQVELVGIDELFPGEEGNVVVEFVVRDESPFPMEVGVKWRMQEGLRLIATAEMVRVLG